MTDDTIYSKAVVKLYIYLYCILSYYYFAMIELIKMDGWMDGQYVMPQ